MGTQWVHVSTATRKWEGLVENSDGRQTSSEDKPGWVGGVSTWIGDHLQTEAVENLREGRVV